MQDSPYATAPAPPALRPLRIPARCPRPAGHTPAAAL